MAAASRRWNRKPILSDQTLHCLDATVIATLVASNASRKTSHSRTAAPFAAAHPISVPKGEQLRTAPLGIRRGSLSEDLSSNRDDDPEPRHKADDTGHSFLFGLRGEAQLDQPADRLCPRWQVRWLAAPAVDCRERVIMAAYANSSAKARLGAPGWLFDRRSIYILHGRHVNQKGRAKW